MSTFVLQEGDLKLTQSMAIVRHLARKFNLVGQTEAECARADMIVDVLGDYRVPLVQMCYNPDFSQELLRDWVEAKGSFSAWPHGRPLSQTLQTLEK